MEIFRQLREHNRRNTIFSEIKNRPIEKVTLRGVTFNKDLLMKFLEVKSNQSNEIHKSNEKDKTS